MVLSGMGVQQGERLGDRLQALDGAVRAGQAFHEAGMPVSVP